MATRKNVSNSVKAIKSVENSALEEKSTKQKRKKGRRKYIYANVTHAYYPLIQEALEGIGFRITDSDVKANLIWINHNGSIEAASELYPYQFYNHFPGTVSICRKVELAKNLDAAAALLPNAYTFNPASFILPYQYNELKNFMLSIKNPRQRTFIIKPDKGSLGKGILLVQDPSTLDSYSQNAIAQKYIDPYLIDGLKFDLRIYVLVTSFDPLRIYVNTEGMARFCTEPYTDPQPNNLDHVFSHLTNYSLNKKNDHFQVNQIVEDEEKGHKRSMTSIFKSLAKDGRDVAKIKYQIDEVIRLTLASVQQHVASQYRIGIATNDGKSRCFEIFGFDIMLDKDCKPWLLEVNNKPSMMAESEFDHKLKLQVIQEAMKIINLQPNFKKSINQRILQLSQSKHAHSATAKLSDPEGESKRAAETKWRQLYPLLQGEKSDIEKALNCLKPTGCFPQKEKRKKEAEVEKNLTLKNAGSRAVSSLLQTRQPLNAKRIVRPGQTEKNFRSTTRTVIQRNYINRTRFATPNKPKEEIPSLFEQMKDLEPNIINEEEEIMRVKQLKKREITANCNAFSKRVNVMISIIDLAQKCIREKAYQRAHYPQFFSQYS